MLLAKQELAIFINGEGEKTFAEGRKRFLNYVRVSPQTQLLVFCRGFVPPKQAKCLLESRYVGPTLHCWWDFKVSPRVSGILFDPKTVKSQIKGGIYSVKSTPPDVMEFSQLLPHLPAEGALSTRLLLSVHRNVSWLQGDTKQKEAYL